jgi:hypothetical protein
MYRPEEKPHRLLRLVVSGEYFKTVEHNHLPQAAVVTAGNVYQSGERLGIW